MKIRSSGQPPLVVKQLETLQAWAAPTPRAAPRLESLASSRIPIPKSCETELKVAELESELTRERDRSSSLLLKARETALDLEKALEVIARLDAKNKQLEEANERLKRSIISRH